MDDLLVVEGASSRGHPRHRPEPRDASIPAVRSVVDFRVDRRSVLNTRLACHECDRVVTNCCAGCPPDGPTWPARPPWTPGASAA